MTTKIQLYLDPEVHRRARERVAQLGISLDEYVGWLMAKDLFKSETALKSWGSRIAQIPTKIWSPSRRTG
jgi:hypothetical protein